MSRPGPDLAVLTDLAAITAQIGWRNPWTGLSAPVTALLDRRVQGKAVLDPAPTTHDIEP